jgi:peptidoglycan hydrolase-like protein with peptidoglycan-binding domain
VRKLQKRLWRLGYLPSSAIDGLDGYRTQQAVMAFQSWEGLDRDGVAGPMTKGALETARRPKPRAGGPAKLIEVYRHRGVALLVKEGRTKRAVHVSAGAPGTETPAGTYEVFRKELNSWSVPFSTWLPYASYFNNGIAFHEYAQVPPYPASHGCVRVPEPEAEFVYRFAAIGTTVRVF